MMPSNNFGHIVGGCIIYGVGIEMISLVLTQRSPQQTAADDDDDQLEIKMRCCAVFKQQ
jgi:putative Mn2+ efflux pump MntP